MQHDRSVDVKCLAVLSIIFFVSFVSLLIFKIKKIARVRLSRIKGCIVHLKTRASSHPRRKQTNNNKQFINFITKGKEKIKDEKMDILKYINCMLPQY